MLPRSQFIFTTCQAGAEGALKNEMARERPGYRFAYSRPGFVTFKGEDFGADLRLSSVFAREYGISLAKATAPEDVLEFARELAPGGNFPRLHVWERDRHAPGEEPMGFEAGKLAAAARASILAAAAARGMAFSGDGPVQDGELVLDAVVVEENEWWLGVHLHSPDHPGDPGGVPPIELPADAPSRAYLKIEEALLRSRAPVRKGDTAVEIGSAPGGASYALLKRGVNVVGVDPAAMNPKVFQVKEASFRHLQQGVATVRREDLPDSVQWLLLDVNLNPGLTFTEIERIVPWLKDSLLGVFLTVKLNHWKIADRIPDILARAKEMGLQKARAKQLYYNRREFLLFGTTRKGSLRT